MKRQFKKEKDLETILDLLDGFTIVDNISKDDIESDIESGTASSITNDINYSKKLLKKVIKGTALTALLGTSIAFGYLINWNPNVVKGFYLEKRGTITDAAINYIGASFKDGNNSFLNRFLDSKRAAIKDAFNSDYNKYVDFKNQLEGLPKEPSYYNFKGTIFYMLSNHQDALDSFDKAKKLSSNNASFKKNHGFFQLSWNHDNAALAALEKVVESSSNNADYNNLLSLFFYSLDRKEDAIIASKRSVQLAPNHAYYNNHLGSMLLMVKRYEEALPFFRKAVDLEPNDAFYNNHLGDVLYNLNRNEESVPFYRKAVKLEPDKAGYNNDLGKILYLLDHNEESVPFCREAVKLEPDDAEYNKDLGKVLSKLGHYEEALPFLEKVVKSSSNDASDNYILGENLSKLGRHKDALEFFRVAVAMNPTNSDYKSTYNEILKILKEKNSASTKETKTPEVKDYNNASVQQLPPNAEIIRIKKEYSKKRIPVDWTYKTNICGIDYVFNPENSNIGFNGTNEIISSFFLSQNHGISNECKEKLGNDILASSTIKYYPKYKRVQKDINDGIKSINEPEGYELDVCNVKYRFVTSDYSTWSLLANNNNSNWIYISKEKDLPTSLDSISNLSADCKHLFLGLFFMQKEMSEYYDSETYHKIGELSLGTNHPELAVGSFKVAFLLDQNNQIIHESLLSAYRDNNLIDEGIAFYSDFLKTNSGSEKGKAAYDELLSISNRNKKRTSSNMQVISGGSNVITPNPYDYNNDNRSRIRGNNRRNEFGIQIGPNIHYLPNQNNIVFPGSPNVIPMGNGIFYMQRNDDD